MLEHIHCNKCFRLDPVKDVSYWLTNCGHIICQQCLDRAQTKEGKKRKAEPDSGDSQADGNISTNEDSIFFVADLLHLGSKMEVFISRKAVKLTAHTFATNLLLEGSESICTICKKPCECINIPEGVVTI